MAGVRERAAAACRRTGRSPEEVTLVAVSKGHPVEAVVAAAEAGQGTFGESRVQEADAKIAEAPSGLVWHLVGHLQRNKAADAVRLFHLVHSLDSPRLARALDKAWRRRSSDAHGGGAERIPVFIQVNVAGEASKYGVAPDAAGDLVGLAGDTASLEVLGLMTIPPWSEDPEDARPHFRALRALRDRLSERLGVDLPYLSMGMSGDFDVAIEEGSTHVRIGTAIFGQRPDAVG